MTFSRRHILKGVSLGAGSVVLSSVTERIESAESGKPVPKRFVFVLQSNGFQPWGAQPKGIERLMRGGPDKVVDLPLAKYELPDDLAPLAPHKKRVTILQRLQGKHCNPFHSGGYAALAGSPKSSRPLAATIDAAIAKAFPGVFPMIGLGVKAADDNNTGTVYICSASGPNQPIATQCNPDIAYRQLFGSVAQGNARKHFDARTSLLEFMKHDTKRVRSELSGDERDKFDHYVHAFESMGDRQKKLAAMSDTLRQHAPERTDKYTAANDKHRMQAQFELAAASLISGLTNVVTICSGLCSPNGYRRGMGMNISLHQLGHRESDGNKGYRELYTMLRQQHMEMIADLIKQLEAVPEGDGNMMDNTVIVFTSDSAETHHSSGVEWPFVLIGNAGGKLRAGRFIEYPAFGDAGNRSINALYCTLLHAAGAPCEHFNLSGATKEVDQPGPLPQLLA